MKKHTFNIFPPANKDDYNLLVADMQANGYDQALPITLFNGDILDGWNRYLACLELNIEPVTVDFTGSEMEAHAFTMRTNKRRNLTSSQWAAVAAEAEEVVQCIAEAVNKRMREKVSISRSSELTQLIVEPERSQNETSHKVAETFNTNRTYVNVAKKLRTEEPEVFERVKSGEATITQATREVKRKEIIERLETVKAREVDAPTGLYDVLVIDPPWQVEKIERDVRPNQTAFDYPTMTVDEISAMELPSAEDCHVFLWTTHKFLPEAINILNAWETKYVCTFVWHKPGGFQPIGLPQYNCEFVLYARIGTPIFIDTKALPVCFNAGRGKHSEKPAEFYELLERVTGGRRLDMFNRRVINGFDTWGNENE